jgi:hypothetical protein
MVKPTEISRASLFACLVKEGDNWLREQLSPIPRYLFRISTPRSDGLTNQTWVKSKAGRLNPDGPSTAERLNRHLRWRGQADDGDNLVSWTSSLLFALLGKLIREFFNQQHCTLQKLTFAQCCIDNRPIRLFETKRTHGLPTCLKARAANHLPLA